MSDQIDISIGGRSYRMAVDEGQESRVKSVAAQFDAYVCKIQEAFSTMDRDQQLVLAAMMMSDELMTRNQEKETQTKSLSALHNNLAERLENLLSHT